MTRQDLERNLSDCGTAGVRVLVGTRKGLFLLAGDHQRREWRIAGPLLEGWAVYHATVDPRDGTCYAAANHIVYGPTVQRSIDGGQEWHRSTLIPLPATSKLTLNAVWHIEPGRPEEPETLYLGGDPGVLLTSLDGGHSWRANEGLLNHPTRDQWAPGAGGMCCHSIQLDPGDPDRMYVAISAAGTFRTDDGGASWMPLNKNVEIDMLAELYPEVGQCVHKLLVHPSRPERLWQQSHCGVYRSDDSAESWERVDGNGLPSVFGFPIMLDPADPDVALVIPEKGYEYHSTSDARLGVYRTDDAGRSWSLFSDGLPAAAWTAVLREASASDAESYYFGTQSGSVFALTGDNQWVEAVRHLPPILSVEVVPWPS
ncbi:WD40/YVTN/BNR-like repeat-containing protein [Kribbella sp. CA-253562]|uniref:WD40/YVTN/BNR-like repeat-containing protein n=1 Tax=Kribbella sp. CA-253562 TaxID=3239942 RepID=UPI003D93806F